MHCRQPSRWDHIEIVKVLLERGSDINMLLEHGADIGALGGKYGNALQAASRWGHIEIVKVLLERGSDIDVQGGEYGNALRAAMSNDHDEIIALLIRHVYVSHGRSLVRHGCRMGLKRFGDK
jgi:ankyrin repeat protein